MVERREAGSLSFRRFAASAAMGMVLGRRHTVGRSHTVGILQLNLGYYQLLWPRNQITSFLRDVPSEAPRVLAIGSFHPGRAVLWPFVAPDGRKVPAGSLVLRRNPYHKILSNSRLSFNYHYRSRM